MEHYILYINEAINQDFVFSFFFLLNLNSAKAIKFSNKIDTLSLFIDD